jgi:hypothetical protein
MQIAHMWTQREVRRWLTHSSREDFPDEVWPMTAQRPSSSEGFQGPDTREGLTQIIRHYQSVFLTQILGLEQVSIILSPTSPAGARTQTQDCSASL